MLLFASSVEERMLGEPILDAWTTRWFPDGFQNRRKQREMITRSCTPRMPNTHASHKEFQDLAMGMLIMARSMRVNDWMVLSFADTLTSEVPLGNLKVGRKGGMKDGSTI